MAEKVLLVDDEPRVLAGYRRNLGIAEPVDVVVPARR